MHYEISVFVERYHDAFVLNVHRIRCIDLHRNENLQSTKKKSLK